MSVEQFLLLGRSTAELVEAHPVEPGRVRPHRLLDGDGFKIRMLTMDAGTTMAEHRSPAPILVQVVSGGIRFRVAGVEHALSPGGTITVAAGELHALEADHPSHILLVLLG